MSDLSAPTLLGLFILAILTGLLVPRRALRDVQKERDSWRSAYENCRESEAEQSVAMNTLLQIARANEAALVGLAHAAAAAGHPIAVQVPSPQGLQESRESNE